jgi:hypothetical protein
MWRGGLDRTSHSSEGCKCYPRAQSTACCCCMHCKKGTLPGVPTIWCPPGSHVTTIHDVCCQNRAWQPMACCCKGLLKGYCMSHAARGCHFGHAPKMHCHHTRHTPNNASSACTVQMPLVICRLMGRTDTGYAASARAHASAALPADSTQVGLSSNNTSSTH